MNTDYTLKRKAPDFNTLLAQSTLGKSAFDTIASTLGIGDLQQPKMALNSDIPTLDQTPNGGISKDVETYMKYKAKDLSELTPQLDSAIKSCSCTDPGFYSITIATTENSPSLKLIQNALNNSNRGNNA